MPKFRTGETVYINSGWLTAEKCTVVELAPDKSSTGEDIYTVNSTVNHGTFCAVENCMFAVKKDAVDAARKERQKKTEIYMSGIRTLEDLIAFPMKHCFNGEEYTDEEAMEAYRIRAEELTGVKL